MSAMFCEEEGVFAKELTIFRICAAAKNGVLAPCSRSWPLGSVSTASDA